MFVELAPVGQKVDSTIHWINFYPVDNPIGRLRAVSNFGDGDYGVDEIRMHAQNFEETRREGSAEN